MGKHAQSRRALLLIMACLLLIAIGPTHAQNTRTGVSPCTIAAEPTALQRLDDGRNGSREQIGLAVWSPNGEQIAVWISRTSTLQAVSDPENWLQIWDAAQGVRIVELPFERNAEPKDISWSADSSKLALAAGNHVHIWEGGQEWSPIVLEVDYYFHWFWQVVWSPDGSQLFTVDTSNETLPPNWVPVYGNILRRWDATTGELLEESEVFEQVFVSALQAQIIIVTRMPDGLLVRDYASGEVLFSLQDGYLEDASFTDGGQWLASLMLEDGNKLRTVWDISNQEALLSFSGNYYSMRLGPTGDFFQIMHDFSWESEVWEIRTGRHFEQSTIGSYQFERALWSPDGQCAIFRGVLPPGYSSHFGMAPDEVIAMWSAAEPERVRLLDGATTWFWGALGGGVAWSPDSMRFTSVDEWGVFKIWQRE